MADSKITALAALTAADPANDMVPIVDVSDNSMAASGTTKRISINNILACSPSATLASATITGDLTVDTSTLKVDSANNRVGIGTASPMAELHVIGGANFSDGTTTLRAVSSGNVAFLGTTTTDPLVLRVNNIEQYRMAQLGVFTWSDGAGGTRMTLNSTGLGLGGTPNTYANYRTLAVVGGSSGGVIDINPSGGVTAGGCQIAATATATTINAVGPSAGAAASLVLQTGTFGSVAPRLTIDGTGNVGIGVTPSAWNATYNVLDIGQNGSISGRTSTNNTIDIVSNGFRNSGGTWVYKLATSSAAARYQVDGGSGAHLWYIGVAGTAGNTIAGFSTASMTLDSAGNLIWSPSATPPTLVTNGNLTVNATSNTNLRFSYRGSDGVTRVANITLA
jgi:hypothetical protein